MADAAKTVAIQDLAQAVTQGVLRALASQAEFKAFVSKGGQGLIAHPVITAGGWLYFGEAGRFANVQGVSTQRIEM